MKPLSASASMVPLRAPSRGPVRDELDDRRLKLLAAGACPTTDPRAGGHAPSRLAGSREAAALAADSQRRGTCGWLAAGEAAAAGLAPAGRRGRLRRLGRLRFRLGGAVGAVAVDGAQAVSTRPDQANSADARESHLSPLSWASGCQQRLVVDERLLTSVMEAPDQIVHGHAAPLLLDRSSTISPWCSMIVRLPIRSACCMCESPSGSSAAVRSPGAAVSASI